MKIRRLIIVLFCLHIVAWFRFTSNDEVELQSFPAMEMFGSVHLRILTLTFLQRELLSWQGKTSLAYVLKLFTAMVPSYSDAAMVGTAVIRFAC